MWLINFFILLFLTPMLVGAAVSHSDFLYVNNLICADSSVFSSLRSSWEACINFSAVGTELTEQFFCAIAILRKELTELRHTLSEEYAADADAIEAWCASVETTSSLSPVVDLASQPIRKYGRKKRSYLPLVIGGSIVFVVSAYAFWFYTLRTKKIDDVVDLHWYQSGNDVVQPVYDRISDSIIGDDYSDINKVYAQPVENVVREHMKHMQQEERVLLKEQPGTKCFPKPVGSRLQVLQTHFALPVREVGESEIRFDEQSPEVKGLILAASLPEISTEQFERSCQEVAAKRLDQCPILALPPEGVVSFRQQKLHELFAQPDLFKNYIYRVFRDAPDPGFFKFCQMILYRIASRSRPVSSDEKPIFELFAQCLVESCRNEIGVRLQEQCASYNGMICHKFSRKITSIAEVVQFTDVCCKDLCDLLLLIKNDDQQKKIIERIIALGIQSIADFVQVEVPNVDFVCYAKTSLVGELWSSKRTRTLLSMLHAEKYKKTSDVEGDDDVRHDVAVIGDLVPDGGVSAESGGVVHRDDIEDEHNNGSTE